MIAKLTLLFVLIGLALARKRWEVIGIAVLALAAIAVFLARMLKQVPVSGDRK